MRIIIIHQVRLPATHYGGSERITALLARGLQALGHDVTIVCAEGSIPGVPCVALDSADALDYACRNADIVHLMAPLSPELLQRIHVPLLLTVHGNGKPGEEYPPYAVFLSKNHALRHGHTHFVYNGLDPDAFVMAQERQNYYAFLSKTSWRVKNLSGAMAIARQAGVSLHIAGGNRPLWAHLRAKLSGFVWHGPVDDSAKKDLLSHARGLLFPILWEEPFGLVMVEAMMSGCPVFASRLGSVPEIVGPDAGCILDPPGDYEPWVQVLKKKFDPLKCRTYAVDRFHYMQMARQYDVLYRRLMAGSLF